MQNHEWHILELMADYEMRRSSFPGKSAGAIQAAKKISTEKKSSMLIECALMCSVLERAS